MITPKKSGVPSRVPRHDRNCGLTLAPAFPLGYGWGSAVARDRVSEREAMERSDLRPGADAPLIRELHLPLEPTP